ncbi:hypothetical protein GOD41_08445 [Sinorhizobium medicae]|nr:hypothetical protein [Sinorhizobium medicae]
MNDFLALVSNLGEGVILVAATNYPDWIDPAILRAEGSTIISNSRFLMAQRVRRSCGIMQAGGCHWNP